MAVVSCTPPRWSTFGLAFHRSTWISTFGDSVHIPDILRRHHIVARLRSDTQILLCGSKANERTRQPPCFSWINGYNYSRATYNIILYFYNFSLCLRQMAHSLSRTSHYMQGWSFLSYWSLGRTRYVFETIFLVVIKNPQHTSDLAKPVDTNTTGSSVHA